MLYSGQQAGCVLPFHSCRFIRKVLSGNTAERKIRIITFLPLRRLSKEKYEFLTQPLCRIGSVNYF